MSAALIVVCQWSGWEGSGETVREGEEERGECIK